MQDFVHLHVHTQYSILDGQSSVKRLVDKAIKDGMRGMAITDHGNMMGVKEYYNYLNSLKGKAKNNLKKWEAQRVAIEDGSYKPDPTKKEDLPYLGKSREELLATCDGEMELARRTLRFKPIFGCEMYVARRGMDYRDRREDQSGWHLVVLAKNEKGYRNLIKLVSNSWTDGFYMRPRTDHKQLEHYHEGLIVSSACLGGEIPKHIIDGDIAAAERSVEWFKRVFGDDFYLELQRHIVKDPSQRANRETYPLQIKVNKVLLKLAEKYQVKLVCTNDCHFVDEDNAEAHDRLICLSTGKDLADPKRMLYTKQEWFKTREEMNELFDDVPEALSNTCEICDKVEEYTIDHAPIMPTFAIPESFGTEESYRKKFSEQELYDEFTSDENGNKVCNEDEGRKKIEKLGGYDRLYRIKLEADYLKELTYIGARKRYGEPVPPEVDERLRFELHVMKTMGFPGYFLIVQDYIAAARNELNVSVGPGRGSAAGSAVAYCLGITQIDPIKYDLLFERFLNPDRISLPDIDVDFDDDGRGRVLDWVTKKYGANKVAHIITYTSMATKSSIKDVARVEGLPLAVTNDLIKAIPDRLPDLPDGTPRKMNLTNAIAAVPELQAAEKSDNPLLSETIRYARMLEGNVRGTGVHACGIIICRDEISDWVPLSTAEDKSTGEKMNCTQYEGTVIEETGLIKMDFLGLKNLSIIRDAIENIKISLGLDIDMDNLDINDPATYQLFCDGRTIGTFQFESVGMQKYLRELQPSVFEDLIAMNALYRPGPMQYIPSFIKRKHGDETIKYDLPCMEKYLKETYGITVYQEQVMLLSREIAGFTRGESDTLRKAMGKKQKDKMEHLKEKFLEGGKKNGYKREKLEKVWNDWEAFAMYAFNKSHATCYSWVAYQTAYLKANFPAQYMSAVMSRSLDDTEEISKYMDDCRSMNIETLGPDINESRIKFSVNNTNNIRYGLGAIKGIGVTAADSIVKERDANGLFKDIYDVMERVDLTMINTRVMQNLVLAGAFDSFNIRREQFFEENAKGESFIEQLIRYGQTFQQDKITNTISLFGDDDAAFQITKPEVPDMVAPWPDLERLDKERDLIGHYLSAHPLDEYSEVLKYLCQPCECLNDVSVLTANKLSVGGIVTEVNEFVSKKGIPFGVVSIEDFKGKGELRIFSDAWTRFRNHFVKGAAIFIRGNVTPVKWAENRKKFDVTEVLPLDTAKQTALQKLTVHVDLSTLDPETGRRLTEIFKTYVGKTPVHFRITDVEDGHWVELMSLTVKANVCRELMKQLQQCDVKVTIND